MGILLLLISGVLIFVVFLYCKYQASVGRAELKIRMALSGLAIALLCMWAWYFLAFRPAQENLQQASRVDDCNSRTHAYYASQEFVKSKLKSPKSAEFPPEEKAAIVLLGNCRFTVSAQVEAKNQFGVILRNSYSADVVFLPALKEWRLNSIEIQ